MIVLLSGLIFTLARWAWMLITLTRGLSTGLSTPGDWSRNSFSGNSFFLLYTAFVAWIITWKVVRSRRNAPACVECGRKFLPPKKAKGPAICPRCRQRALSPTGLKKEQTKGLWTGLVSLAFFTSVMGLVLSDLVADRFSQYYWVILPLLALGATLGLLVAILTPFILLALIRGRLMRGEKYALARARKVAGEEGEELSLGAIRLWYSGSTDPAPMLLEQLETVRGRFAEMVGEAIEVPGPLRLYCFDRRDALVEFVRQKPTDLWNFDAIHTPPPARLLGISTEVVRHRLCDTEATARSLFALDLLERFKGFFPAPWLQAGIIHTLTNGEEGLDPLNRKMVVALASGTALGVELFQFKPSEYFRLVKNWPVHENHARLSQFAAQSWSLIGYLGGPDAPEDRRNQFRAYLKAIQRRESNDAVFQIHFGHGHDRLLESWKGWVMERGVGTHGAPSPRIRDALMERLIPTVLDQRAKIMDRILAVRGMGWTGHVLGADALIELLRDGSEVPKEEVVWSLEAISGMAWGDDLERWTTWWENLPQEVRAGRGHQADHPEKQELPSRTTNDA
jgi:hypothetical protein